MTPLNVSTENDTFRTTDQPSSEYQNFTALSLLFSYFDVVVLQVTRITRLYFPVQYRKKTSP